MSLFLKVTPLLITLAFVACSSNKTNGDSDAKQEPIQHEEEKVALTVVVTDASTGLPVENAEVAFSGELASSLLSPSGSAVESEELASGSGSFFVDGGETGTLSLVAKADGYLSASKSVNVIDGSNRVEVSLLSLEAEVEGVDVVVESMTASSTGKVAAKQVFNAQVANNENAVALTINKDVLLKDGAGKPVTGELEVVIASFTPSEAGALSSLPSDLTVTSEDGEDMVSVVAAFVDINITSENGSEVKTLNPAAQIEVTLDPSAKDPISGEAFKAGDKLSVWSSSNGELKYEGETTVSETGSVILSISHLTSYWVSKDVTTCGDNSPTLVLDGSEGADLSIAVEGLAGQYTLTTASNGQTSVVLTNFPSSQPDVLVNVVLAGVTLANKTAVGVKCGDAVLVPVKLPAKKGTVSVTVVEQCGDDSKSANVVPSAPVYFYSKDGALASIALTNAEGTASVVLPHGSYNLDAQGRSSNQHFTKGVGVDGDESIEVVFSVDCEDLTGAE